MTPASRSRRASTANNPCQEPPPPLLLRGIEQFNHGDFFEQHETLELLWRQETRPVRALYQGILQIGVAFHHLRRNNHHGMVYMLSRGIEYLKPFSPVCQGVDVAALIQAASDALAEARDLGRKNLTDFDLRLVPRVECVR